MFHCVLLSSNFSWMSLLRTSALPLRSKLSMIFLPQYYIPSGCRLSCFTVDFAILAASIDVVPDICSSVVTHNKRSLDDDSSCSVSMNTFFEYFALYQFLLLKTRFEFFFCFWRAHKSEHGQHRTVRLGLQKFQEVGIFLALVQWYSRFLKQSKICNKNALKIIKKLKQNLSTCHHCDLLFCQPEKKNKKPRGGKLFLKCGIDFCRWSNSFSCKTMFVSDNFQLGKGNSELEDWIFLFVSESW